MVGWGIHSLQKFLHLPYSCNYFSVNTHTHDEIFIIICYYYASEEISEISQDVCPLCSDCLSKTHVK